jgi:hypothetical protein
MAWVAALAVALTLLSWVGLADRGGIAVTTHRTVLRLRRQQLVDATHTEVEPRRVFRRLFGLGQAAKACTSACS